MTKSISVEARQYLSIDSLIQGLRERFEAIPDPRRAASTVEHQRGQASLIVPWIISWYAQHDKPLGEDNWVESIARRRSHASTWPQKNSFPKPEAHQRGLVSSVGIEFEGQRAKGKEKGKEGHTTLVGVPLFRVDSYFSVSPLV